MLLSNPDVYIFILPSTHSQLLHLIIAFDDLQMQLRSLQLPTKLQAAVQQQLLQVADQVTDQATEEDEVGEVSGAIAVT